MRAYDELATERPIGMSVGLIPWSRMQKWCEIEGLDNDATRIMIGALRYVDVQEFKKRNAKTPPRRQGAR